MTASETHFRHRVERERQLVFSETRLELGLKQGVASLASTGEGER